MELVSLQLTLLNEADRTYHPLTITTTKTILRREQCFYGPSYFIQLLSSLFFFGNWEVFSYLTSTTRLHSCVTKLRSSKAVCGLTAYISNVNAYAFEEIPVCRQCHRNTTFREHKLIKIVSVVIFRFCLGCHCVLMQSRGLVYS